MKRKLGLFGSALAMLLFSSAAALAGPKVDFDGGYLTLGVLGQVQGLWVDEAADKEDTFLRRGRLIFSGQIADGIKVFAETDIPNLGRTGTNASFVMQDAFADVRVWGDHGVQAGLILLPFSFETASSAASLLGLDYNAECIKLTNSLTWRDLGLQAHGSFGPWVSYKAGVFDGYDAPNKNEKAAQRITGHLAVNLLGTVESGWFYNQVRLDKPNYLSLGAGVDTQKDATATSTEAGTRIKDADAWVADLQAGWGVGPVYVILDGAYYHWKNAIFTGPTAFLEGGVLYEKAMLTLKWARQDPDGEKTLDDGTVGLHYFLRGNNLRAGVEYRSGDSPTSVLAGVQFLL